ncbi:3-oxoacyl-[acyl-carrier-protein] reductase FabG-like [Lytechinus variegatus]|uniref:3-oxoacyl-[acyl-carrier-protein] reductase FabG-like n=1 Tax=Lytechinus variegatus TaxID=7654 RepID=UPI001BB1BDB8|nr:3-oxoacyl-[acyl-carrier-protein] reductase FabG-like [Lytechinus variegatus]
MSSSAPATLGGSLKGKVALITGASSGIGAETARYFASLGCQLALTGRNMDALQAVTDECVSRGLGRDQILMIQASFDQEADVKKTAEQTIQKFNQLDVLVNNAGIVAPDSVETESVLENFDKTFAVNVRACLQLTKLMSPYLIKTKGTIVNVSSVNGVRAMRGVLTYCMSKTALDHMTRCIAEELAPHGVRVNAVNPGVIQTQIHRRGGMSDERYQQFMDHSKTTHAMRRTGTVDEVSKLIAFLASSDSSFTTGETITIDGGRHLLTIPVQS